MRPIDGWCAAAASIAATVLAPICVTAAEEAARRPTVEAPVLEDVVVTAQRREESLQDVPISVTALTGQQLAEHQIIEFDSLAALVPGVWIGQNINDPTDLAIGIRGIALANQFAVLDPTVGIYVNGVYLSRTSGANLGFVDMERVEVLKGPQGTLFGRNTIGGAFNITTRRPEEQFGGSATVDFGNYDIRNFTGTINVPIGSAVGARVVYQHAEHSGYGRNVFLEQDASDLDQDFVRATVRFEPSDSWEIVLWGDHLSLTGQSQFIKLGFYNAASPNNANLPAANGNPGDLITNYLGSDFYENESQINPRIELDVSTVSGEMTGDLGSVSIKSITAYREEDANRPGGYDGTPYPVLEQPDKPFRYHQFSQELQLYGNAAQSRFEWIAGLYYFREKARQGQTSVVLVPLAANASIGDYAADNESYAAFAQGTFEIFPHVRLTAGARWTEDSRQATYYDKVQNNQTGIVTCSVPVASRDDPSICQSTTPVGKASYVPFTVGLDYRPTDDALFYAKLSKGYRSGGFLTAAPTDPLQAQAFGPEELLSPELGAKLDLWDRKLRVNVAAYYSEYEDIQQTVNAVNAAGNLVSITSNVGTARIYGGELEANALLNRLELAVSLGIVRPKYTDGPAEGTTYTNVSDVSWAMAADYRFDVPFGTLAANVDYVWRSEQRFFNPGLAGSQLAVNALTQESYGLLGAKLSLRFAKAPNLSLSAWGRNLTDEEYLTRAADFSGNLGFIGHLTGDPRTYGVSAEYTF